MAIVERHTVTIGYQRFAGDRPESDCLHGIPATIDLMERKIFWLVFTVLGLAADFVLPLWWALGATIPLVFISWWVAYRSGWFE